MEHIFIGLDDTDNKDSPHGTGWVAREIANQLRSLFGYRAVSRHQLLKHESIPYTKNNSANVIHITEDAGRVHEIAEYAQVLLHQYYAANSAPGLCVGLQRQLCPLLEFAKKCQRQVVSKDEARQLASQAGVYLKAFSTDDRGIIGALAGAVLAADGNDGRYIALGKIRKLRGIVTVEALREAGVSRVLTKENEELYNGEIDVGEKGPRPAIRDHKAILYVDRGDDSVWKALKL